MNSARRSIAEPDASTSGAIVGKVLRNGVYLPDQNNFITALWLREYRSRQLPQSERLARLRQRALDYLEGAAAATAANLSGGYAFWRPDLQPDWASGVVADIDDSALANHELWAAGRLSTAECKRRAYHLFTRARVPANHHGRPVWATPGCYYTWLPTSSARENIIDVCANTNAVALLAALGAKSAPGYAQACRTISDAIEWSDVDSNRLRAITPYYPNVWEFYRALRHAVDSGASELAPALRRIAEVSLSPAAQRYCGPICSSSYGHIHWYSKAIEKIRRYPNKHHSVEESKACAC